MLLARWVSSRVFRFVHGHNLVYNTCWEDPRLDRVALELGPHDTVLMITSAGCNALDYVLTGPERIHAVDMNPRQNALLELKIAGIRHLEFEDFFSMFGEGRLRDARRVYAETLRPALSLPAQRYWDRSIRYFDHPRHRFYFYGTSGVFARMMNWYLDHILHARHYVRAVLEATTVAEQRQIYMDYIRPRLWTRGLKFAMQRDSTLSLVGVPRDQRLQVERGYEGGIVKFIQDCVDAVFGILPLQDNYFWRVYLTGQYTPECCPEYLKPENFQQLKGGLVDRISIHTASLQQFLLGYQGHISRFVLLDHMDWLSSDLLPVLQAEWQALMDRACQGARMIWRSGGLRTDFVDRLRVTYRGMEREVGELLRYQTALAAQLHAQDRVHTYGSFYIAELSA